MPTSKRALIDEIETLPAERIVLGLARYAM